MPPWDATGSSGERVVACPVITLGNGVGERQGPHRVRSWAGAASRAAQPLVRVGSPP